MRILPAVVGLILALSFLQPALAQSRARVFDLQLGTPVSQLPLDEWVDPACGTNGGPPSIKLASFADFDRCRVEEATGLREIWFIYDDEWEYIARAYRDAMEIMTYSANVFYAQQIITSLLVDAQGLVQGYRVITDPRASVDDRLGAAELHMIFKGLFNEAPWQCINEPLADRERTVNGKFIKADCTMVSDTKYVHVVGRLLRKPGQDLRDVVGMSETAEGDFESTARVDVYARQAVRNAPCCTVTTAE